MAEYCYQQWLFGEQCTFANFVSYFYGGISVFRADSSLSTHSGCECRVFEIAVVDTWAHLQGKQHSGRGPRREKQEEGPIR